MKDRFPITKWLLLIAMLVVSGQCYSQSKTELSIFTGGQNGYQSYRIPSIVATVKGTLIAFCEGRVTNSKDYGDIDVVYKRSFDNGKTWSALGLIAGGGADTISKGTFGNPTVVEDRTTGRLWLMLSWNDFSKNQKGGDGKTKVGTGDRQVYVSHSDDDGKSWSAPVNITGSVQPEGMTWDAVGPGAGIQTKINHPGRLIIPAIGRNIYSDDHGKTWTFATLPDGTSEATITELADGSFFRNDRAVTSVWETGKRRWVSTGKDLNSFAPFAPHDQLLDPRCEGSMMIFNTGGRERIIFLNSASMQTRLKMYARISYDGGKTWPVGRGIYDELTDAQQHDSGKGGYSSLTQTADGQIGALIEQNDNASVKSQPVMSVVFVKFGLPWLLNGKPEPVSK